MLSREEKHTLSFLLAKCDQNGLTACAYCERLCLEEDMHTYVGSMRKEWSVCPECDLKEGWKCKYSSSRSKRRYYVCEKDGRSQWEHPSKEDVQRNKRARQCL